LIDRFAGSWQRTFTAKNAVENNNSGGDVEYGR